MVLGMTVYHAWPPRDNRHPVLCTHVDVLSLYGSNDLIRHIHVDGGDHFVIFKYLRHTHRQEVHILLTGDSGRVFNGGPKVNLLTGVTVHDTHVSCETEIVQQVIHHFIKDHNVIGGGHRRVGQLPR